MSKTALSLAISVVMAYPMTSSALGLGELHSSSQLNQPLNAQIDLLSTNKREASQLQVKLASPDVFNRVGIDRPAFLDSLTFTPSVQNGKPVIRVTSSAPISEPFLNFLLEVSWPQGQLLKEYTVLLDPPVLMNAGSASTENAVAIRAEPKSTGVVNRGQDAERIRAQQQRQRQLEVQRQQQAQAQAQRQQQDQAQQNNYDAQFEAQARAALSETASATPATNRSTKYRVKRGDTMSRITSRLRYRGVTNSQMMVALFRANPQAFSHSNINELRTGALLSKPAKSKVRSNSHAEAKQIVKQHYSQWKKYRSELANHTVAQTATPKASTSSSASAASQVGGVKDQANLSVVGSGKSAASDIATSAAGTAALHKELTLAQEALASSKSESAELHSRVSKLEAIIRKKERLITLKNERLAKLESQLANGNNTAVSDNQPKQAQEPAVTEPADLVQQVANQDEQDNNRIIRGEANGSEAQPTQPEVNSTMSETASVEDEAATNPFKTDDSEKKGGILDLLSSPLVAAVGVGSLLALLFGWSLMRRSSTELDVEDVADDVLADEDNNLFDDESGSELAEHDSPIIDDMEADSTQHIDTEKDDADAFDSILSGDDAFDEDEILQEADVYIVYGLHDQAEDELKKAISDHPSKMEYRYKLLENYKAASNPESFVTSAKEFLNAEGENKQQLWDKIVEWGKELVPENELFSESSASKAAKVVAGVASVGAATHMAHEAFSPDSNDSFADAMPPELDSTEDLNITGLDDGDFNLDIGDELDTDLDLGDDFGLDELSKDFDAPEFDLGGSDNIIDFGSTTPSNPSKDLEDAVANETSNDLDDLGLDLNIDQDNDLDKILPTGNGYTSTSSDIDTASTGDDSLDDALSFLDLSDDDEEVQQAHIGTKLDLARAYLDMGDVEGARHTLEEVVIEGNDDQKREAEELLLQTG